MALTKLFKLIHPLVGSVWWDTLDVLAYSYFAAAYWAWTITDTNLVRVFQLGIWRKANGEGYGRAN